MSGNGGGNCRNGPADLGNDSLHSDAGNDYLDGGTGSSFALYSTSTAVVTLDLSIATAQLTGGAGRDTLTGIEKLTVQFMLILSSET